MTWIGVVRDPRSHGGHSKLSENQVSDVRMTMNGGI